MIIVGSKIMTYVCIFYYPEENLFKDSKNRIIYGFFKLVPVWKVLLFKKNKRNDEFINYQYGIIVKLLYPINQEKENNHE